MVAEEMVCCINLNRQRAFLCKISVPNADVWGLRWPFVTWAPRGTWRFPRVTGNGVRPLPSPQVSVTEQDLVSLI